MIIGVPRETKKNEFRVAVTPDGLKSLLHGSHEILIEEGAGTGSGYLDDEYRDKGARVVSREELFSRAELIVKVKEPQPEEFSLLRPGQIVFGYFHLAASEELTRACLDAGIVALAFETLEGPRGDLPLLAPMSAIAGRLSIQVGAHFLEKAHGGSGVLLGGVPGVTPGHVTIVGAGVVGENAARIAAGIGADVVILDVDGARLSELAGKLPPNVRTLYSSEGALEQEAERADLLVAAVYLRGRRAPKLIERALLSRMKAGSVLCDVCVDQGGAAETSRPTTHENPVFVVDGVTHYCVANMPGAVPRTSTNALAAAVLPSLRQLADAGLEAFLARSPGQQKALNLARGAIMNPDVAATFPALPAAC